MLLLIGKLTFDLSAMTGMGVTIALVGYTIVFIALVLLYMVFRQIPRLIAIQTRRKLRKEGKIDAEEKELHIQGEVSAAIGMALHAYFKEMELHDEEDLVLTMKRVQKRYSPWSSKIYNVMNFRR